MRVILAAGSILSLAAATLAAMRVVPAGSYQAFVLERPAPGKPLIPVTMSVDAFHMDAMPVSNHDFLRFLRMHPKWQRSKISRIFADESYLSHWRSDLAGGASPKADAPVTFVSWFAARAYCKAQGKRLPTLNEWEFAARPEAFGREHDKMLTLILEWYSRPATTQLAPASKTELLCTSTGICGLHGLVWEWVEDFSSIIATEEGRTSGSPDSDLFCGGGSVGSMDPNNYAAFMRYAFRSSLKGTYTIGHLGFRCVKL